MRYIFNAFIVCVCVSIFSFYCGMKYAEIGRPTEILHETSRLAEERGDERPERQFLKEVREIANQMDVFPVDLIARKGPLSYYWYGINRPKIACRMDMRLTDFRLFYDFCVLALYASEKEIDSCLETLNDEPPKIQALLLTAIYIRSYPWQDFPERITNMDEAQCFWSWLAMNVYCFAPEIKKRPALSEETRQRYKNRISDYVPCRLQAFGAVTCSEALYNSQHQSDLAANTYFMGGKREIGGESRPGMERVEFCRNLRINFLNKNREIIPDMLFYHYSGDFRPLMSGMDWQPKGNASSTPKTVGQIATQLLESWEPVALDEEGQLRRKDESD